MNPKKKKSFRLGIWLLSRLVNRQKNYGLYGDIEEIYNLQAAENGHFKATLWFWLQVLKTIPAYLKDFFYWGFVMFYSYLKITFRNFKRHKIYSIINVVGLAIGMACCICILVYVRFELNYDKFHTNSDNIYRLVMNGDFSGKPFDVALSSGPIGPALAKDFPEVDNFVRFQRKDRTSVNYKEIQFFEEKVFWAETSMFEVFTFPLSMGDPRTALKDPFSAVITQKTASRYFGNKNPIGKILQFNRETDYLITGVMKNIPENSHFNFDILLSYETLMKTNLNQIENWSHFTNYTYLLLKENVAPLELETKIPAINEMHFGFNPKSIGWNLKFTLQPLSRIHLHSKLQAEIKENSDITYIYVFSSIAFLILLLASINFMNLATARSTNRAKEVGLRKVLGAIRSKLIKQFLGESLIHSFISLFLAMIIVELALPFFSMLSDRPLDIRYLEIPWLIPMFIGFTIIVGLVSGSYPALVHAGFQPAKVLKGGFNSNQHKKHFRSVLVVFQLSISTFLIIGTAIIIKQIKFMKNEQLGFDKEQVIVLQSIDDSVRQSMGAIKQELKSLPGVLDVTASSHIPGWGGVAMAHQPEGFSIEEVQMMRVINIDDDFLNTMGIKLSAGRNFIPKFQSDPGESVLINETAAKRFGWDDPLGKKIIEIYGSKQTKTVIGVVEDFHMSSLHETIEPMYLNNQYPGIETISIRISSENIPSVIKSIESRWKAVASNVPFDYFFLDETFNNQYQDEERLSQIFFYFSLLAIFIACLGIFGMACFTTEQRTKEIGIRKVLGVSTSGIIFLLSQELIKLFLMAILFTWPIVYLISRKWLQNFAYRANIGLGIFLFSAILTFIIFLGTLSYLTIKAALANPVNSLQYE